MIGLQCRLFHHNPPLRTTLFPSWIALCFLQDSFPEAITLYFGFPEAFAITHFQIAILWIKFWGVNELLELLCLISVNQIMMALYFPVYHFLSEYSEAAPKKCHASHSRSLVLLESTVEKNKWSSWKQFWWYIFMLLNISKIIYHVSNVILKFLHKPFKIGLHLVLLVHPTLYQLCITVVLSYHFCKVAGILDSASLRE